MAEQLIIMDPTEEVFSKCLDGIASGLITVMSRADFPVGEKYPEGGLNYTTAKGVLILSPSTPLISPKHLERREGAR